jgi:hypothetical protein
MPYSKRRCQGMSGRETFRTTGDGYVKAGVRCAARGAAALEERFRRGICGRFGFLRARRASAGERQRDAEDRGGCAD